MRRQERLHQEVQTHNKKNKHDLNEEIKEVDPNAENGDDQLSQPETEEMQETINQTADNTSENDYEVKSHIHDKRQQVEESDGKEGHHSTDS